MVKLDGSIGAYVTIITNEHFFPFLLISYFRPPKGAKAEVARKWTEKERELLIKGIEKHGIGHFREISEEFLSAWVRFLLYRSVSITN